MPTLFRLLMMAGILAGAVYGGAFFVSKYYEPKPREVKQDVYDFKVQSAE